MKSSQIIWKTVNFLVRQVWAPVDAQEPPDHAAYFVLRDGVPTLCCEQHRFYPREPLPFPGVSARR
jgi:hypothetical protein